MALCALGTLGAVLWTVNLAGGPACASPPVAPSGRSGDPRPARPLGIRVEPGSTTEWLAVQVLDHGGPLRSVEVRVDGRWRALKPRANGSWVARNGAGDGPLTFRVTDVRDHTRTVDDLDLTPGEVQRTDAYLYGGADPSPVARTGPAAPDGQRVTC
ncbi:expansin C-terminal domain-related protein [Nonomuraea sp. NBC_01738]|uniref:expansin C-terminal domain-related protein n=1 Tax=Nonomuraea sp. NBC_01738 TaxID=2976003 RepID=UPI002E0D9A91|nr:expansin C-terminal domain-related protein [Nonomuraea sp. NBC_01738]